MDNLKDSKGDSDSYSDEDEDTKGGSVGSPRGVKRSLADSSESGGNNMTEDEKKAERRAANRRSAFQSRQRRKILIEDLQRTVAALSKDNTSLRKSNDELRLQLEATLLENHQFRMQQQLAGLGAVGAGAGAGGGGGGLFAQANNSSALQQIQAAAALQSAGGSAGNSGGQTMSQLLSSIVGASSGPAASVGGGGGSSSSDTEALLNARLALAAASQQQPQAPNDTNPNPSPNSAVSHLGSLQGAAAGLQSLLESAARVGSSSGGAIGSPPATTSAQAPASDLQGLLLESLAGRQLSGGGIAGLGAAHQLVGLQSLLESAARGENMGGGAGGGMLNITGLTEMQRAILQEAVMAGMAANQGAQNAAPAISASQGNNQPHERTNDTISTGVSEALRNYLQKNQRP